MAAWPVNSSAVKIMYAEFLGSGKRTSMRRALGLATYGMRHDAERFDAEYASITGASKPGTRRLQELVVEMANALTARECLKMPPMYHSAIWLRPPLQSPDNGFTPPLSRSQGRRYRTEVVCP